MKKKIILGLLILVVLLCFLAQSWALDWKKAQQQYYEHPEQEVDLIPVNPSPTGAYPNMVKFIIIPYGQTLPLVIPIDKTRVQAKTKIDNSTKSSTTSLSKIR